MDITIILALIPAIFYIVLIFFMIRWLTTGGKVSKTKVAHDIEELAKKPEYAPIAYYYNGLANFVKTGILPVPPPAAAPTYREEPSPDSSQEQTNNKTNTWSTQPTASLAPASSLTAAEAFKSLSNINILLYLGAFLVVVSASIFVGYNFTTLSGNFKTVFLGLFAAGFYGLGLVFYLRMSKLKPAGTTFTAIGLIMAPLVGLAAYNFIFAQTNGRPVWFFTSLLTLVLYAVSAAILRKHYIAYLMAFTALSMVESSLSLFNLPVYYLTWAMSLTAMAFLLVRRMRGLWVEVEQSLYFSANIFVPLAIFGSLMLISGKGSGQLGVNLILAAAFYGLSSWLTSKTDQSEAYFAAAIVLLPAGFWLLAQQNNWPPVALAELLSAFGIIYSGSILLTRAWVDRRSVILGLIGSLIASVAAFDVVDQPINLVFVLLVALVCSSFVAWRQRRAEVLAIALLIALILPIPIFRQWLQPALGAPVMAVIYLGLSGLLLEVRFRIAKWSQSITGLTILAYAAGLTVSLVWAVSAGSLTIAWTAFLLALIVGALSYLEFKPELIVLSTALLYLAALQLPTLLKLDRSSYALVLMLAAFALAALAQRFDKSRAKYLRFGGIVGSYGGALAGVGLETASISPIASLFVAAALTGIEARAEGSKTGLEVAAGVAVLASEWLLHFLGMRQLQIFTHIWAAFFAALAYIRHRRQSNASRDNLTALALGILTIPLAGQALAPDGQLYGLVLILESLLLVVAGIALRYKLVTYWGITVLVLEVLYQLRDFFYALPKYAISAVLGVGLLVAAIVLLSRRKD